MFTCQYCFASRIDETPHGDGVPCPQKLEMHVAQLKLVRAQAGDVQSQTRQRDSTLLEQDSLV